MAEAFCKMRLGDFVHDEDVDTAIRVMLESFINSQKFSVSSAWFVSGTQDHWHMLHDIDMHKL